MTDARDYSATLFLPQTDFPMRAGLPQKEPELLARWARLGMYARLRGAAKGPWTAFDSSASGQPPALIRWSGRLRAGSRARGRVPRR